MAANNPASGTAGSGTSHADIQRQAAEWLALRRARRLTAGEESAFTTWCAVPRQAEMLAEVEAADRIFDRLAFYPRPADQPVDPDLLVRRQSQVRASALLVLTAAAASIAAVFLFRLPAPAPAVPAMPVTAGVHFLRLSDGSRVELNSGSEVAEHFTAGERRIRLVRGEAHFEVAKNPLRPFIVEADSVAVRAVGTAFDVRLGATAVDVLVTEGRVGVTTAADRAGQSPANQLPRDGAVPAGLGPGLILSAGQHTAVPTTPAPREPAPLVVEDLTAHQIDRALAWQSSRLVFEAMPLAEVVARFNRSAVEQDGPTALQLKVSDAGLAAMRISGRVRYDSIENFVDVLQDDFGVKAERQGREIILRRDR